MSGLESVALWLNKISDSLEDSASGVLFRAAEQASELYLVALREATPVRVTTPDTGFRRPAGGTAKSTTRKAIVGRTARSITFGYYAPGYMKYVIGGTAPHKIAAVNAPELMYWSQRAEEWRWRDSVEHPGSKPNNYPRGAWRRCAPTVRLIMERAGKEVLNVR